MYGLPDSWVGWGVKRGLKWHGGSRGGRGTVTTTTRRYKTSFTWKLKGVKFFEPEMNQFLNQKRISGPHNPPQPAEIWRHLDNAAAKAVAGARAKAGMKTGALRRSIHARHTGNWTGQYIWIGSEKDYALFHHQGTRPHPIRARDGGLLVFTGKFKNPKANKYGRNTFSYRKVMVESVNHPGTRANHYLTSQRRHFKNVGRAA